MVDSPKQGGEAKPWGDEKAGDAAFDVCCCRGEGAPQESVGGAVHESCVGVPPPFGLAACMDIDNALALVALAAIGGIMGPCAGI